MNKKLALRILKHIRALLIIYLIWWALAGYQCSRYVANVCDCSDMSKDCEQIFEALGIHTQVMRGVQYDESGNVTVWHCWLLLHTWIGNVEFESTGLYFSPISKDFDVWLINEGWYDGVDEIL